MHALKRGPVFATDLIRENVPRDGGPWAIRCACGEPLTFAYRDRGTEAATLLVTHGGFPARFELAQRDADSLLWAVGLADPLGAWLGRVHEYIDDDAAEGAAGCAASAGELPA